MEEARNIPSAGFVGPIDDARLQLQHLTDELNANLDNGLLAARIAPTMLGADGPRTYFLAFQTPAEARGTGGLVGGFGVIRAEDGSVGMDSLASNNNIPFWKKYAPLDLGPDFAETYSFTDRSATTDLRNSNFSSNFPYAGKIWQSLWEQESGMRIDGAIATDPIALSYILAAIGPVRLPGGDVVSADNIVETTMSTNYIRFADDNDARKQYLQDIAAAVVSKMTGDLEAPQALLEAFGRAAREGRLAVWSDHPAEQAVLASTAVGHTVADVASPYAEVVINNHGGNKMDYYLRREIDYSAADCASDTRKSTVTVRLTNAATPEVAKYPHYIAGAVEERYQGVPRGTDLPMVSLLATRGATLDRVTVNGYPTIALRGGEVGHPVFSARTAVPLGETVEVRFELTEPTTPGDAIVPVQPLIDEPAVTVDVPVCDN